MALGLPRPRIRRRLLDNRVRLERSWLARGTATSTRSTGRVLCYHSVGTPQWGINDVAPRRFERHLQIAHRAGYRFVPAADIARTGGEPMDLALTFDDGLISVARNAAPILRELRIPWSLFVVTGWSDGRPQEATDPLLMRWREIEALARAGATIGAHSVSHANFSGLDAEQMLLELDGSRRAIQRRLGIVPDAFAIPFGRARDWPAIATTLARQVGYQHIYAQSENRRPAGTVARTFITRSDDDRTFAAALRGAFDDWEETF